MNLRKRTEAQVTVTPVSHGHWRVETTRYGKKVSAIITDSLTVDRFNSLKTDRGRGYKQVCKDLTDLVLWKADLKK